MTPARWRRVSGVVLILSMLTMLTGCWDSKELNHLFILTGLGLDAADDPDQISVTAQVADIKKGDSGSGEAKTESGNAVILMHTVSDSLMRGLTEMDRDSNYTMLFQHNQIRLFGIALAEQGIEKHLDMIMRDQQARLEVPLAVVDGRAEEALTVNLEQEPISGIYFAGMFDDLAQISGEYRVRLIDFVHRLLDDAAAPVLPIVKVTSQGDKQEIKLDGMAVFHEDKMIGRLTNDETLGYIWSFGNVKKCNAGITDGPNKATLHITELDCKREVTLRQDGGVRVSLTVNSVIRVGEIYGFSEMKPPELIDRLEKLAEEEIEKKITDCFVTAQRLNADIFGYCTQVYRKYPKQWNEMKDRWDEIFADIDFSVRAKARIPETGQIVPSLEMESKMK